MRPWARPQGKMGPAARLSPTRSPISRLGAAFSRTPGSRRRLGRCRRSTRQVLGRKRLRREAVPYRALDGERERVEADAHDDSAEPVFPRPQYRRQQAHVLVVIDWAAPSDRRHGIRRPPPPLRGQAARLSRGRFAPRHLRCRDPRPPTRALETWSRKARASRGTRRQSHPATASPPPSDPRSPSRHRAPRAATSTRGPVRALPRPFRIPPQGIAEQRP